MNLLITRQTGVPEGAICDQLVLVILANFKKAAEQLL
jgi:hypothetical protein